MKLRQTHLLAQESAMEDQENYVKSITKSDNDDIRCILKARKILENVIKSEKSVW